MRSGRSRSVSLYSRCHMGLRWVAHVRSEIRIQRFKAKMLLVHAHCSKLDLDIPEKYFSFNKMKTKQVRIVTLLLTVLLTAGWLQPIAVFACCTMDMGNGMAVSASVASSGMQANASMQDCGMPSQAEQHPQAHGQGPTHQGTPMHECMQQSGMVAHAMAPYGHQPEGPVHAGNAHSANAQADNAHAHKATASMAAGKVCAMKTCVPTQAPVPAHQLDFSRPPAKAEYTALSDDTCIPSSLLGGLFRPPRLTTSLWG